MAGRGSDQNKIVWLGAVSVAGRGPNQHTSCMESVMTVPGVGWCLQCWGSGKGGEINISAASKEK